MKKLILALFAFTFVGFVNFAYSDEMDVESTFDNIKFSYNNEFKKNSLRDNEFMNHGFADKSKKDRNNNAIISFKGEMSCKTLYSDFFKKSFEEFELWKNIRKSFLLCSVYNYATEFVSLQKWLVCKASISKLKTTKYKFF